MVFKATGFGGWFSGFGLLVFKDLDNDWFADLVFNGLGSGFSDFGTDFQWIWTGFRTWTGFSVIWICLPCYLIQISKIHYPDGTLFDHSLKNGGERGLWKDFHFQWICC